MRNPGWYVRRLSRMGPREVSGRAVDAWRVRRGRDRLHETSDADLLPRRRFAVPLPAGAVAGIPATAVARLTSAADRLMEGHRDYFGLDRDDMVAPDWALDPKTGRRAPTDVYAFDVRYREEQVVGDIKQIWEPSRHQHLTVLAAAYAVTGDERYANRVADHLKSWWAANPPMRGVHWISGIELGIRLVSWVWIRRLLDGWSEAPGLFEDNAEALHQIRHHQLWLAGFPSRGSSANNHVVAELAGQLTAACAFPWFPESEAWRVGALEALDEQLQRNTFRSGVNRELATEYHGLVLELGLAAAVEADAVGMPVPDSTWLVLARMVDALAAMVDVRGRPPRQGDGDDGHGLVLDGPDSDHWASLLATGERLFGRLQWWPPSTGTDVRATVLASLTAAHAVTAARPVHRPAHFADAGLTVLRTDDGGTGEIWCRCDGGPHGFLSIAAHAHADALSIEVRHNGIDVLADPGCYCYHGEPAWRSYFRSTLGHNTLELDGQDQSRSGGPFLWTHHARTRVLGVHPDSVGVSRWHAEHEGYSRRGRPVVHRRTVELDGAVGELRVLDEVVSSSTHQGRLAFHLGPAIEVELAGATALLRWTAEGLIRTALLALPVSLDWQLARGSSDPPIGWYSDGFGRRRPSTTIVGSGRVGAGCAPMATGLRFDAEHTDMFESVSEGQHGIR